jgi:hypothetical protein
VLSSIRVVKAFAREDYEKDKFERVNRKLFDARVEVVSSWGIFWPTMSILVLFSTALILWFGGQMVIAGTLSLGELVAFFHGIAEKLHEHRDHVVVGMVVVVPEDDIIARLPFRSLAFPLLAAGQRLLDRFGDSGRFLFGHAGSSVAWIGPR